MDKYGTLETLREADVIRACGNEVSIMHDDFVFNVLRLITGQYMVTVHVPGSSDVKDRMRCDWWRGDVLDYIKNYRYQHAARAT